MEPQTFEVWPENWPAVDLFLLCQTQWRMGPGGIAGLDYGAVLSVARLWGMKRLRETMADVQVIEAAILAERSRRVG